MLCTNSYQTYRKKKKKKKKTRVTIMETANRWIQSCVHLLV